MHSARANGTRAYDVRIVNNCCTSTRGVRKGSSQRYVEQYYRRLRVHNSVIQSSCQLRFVFFTPYVKFFFANIKSNFLFYFFYVIVVRTATGLRPSATGYINIIPELYIYAPCYNIRVYIGTHSKYNIV